MVGDFGRARIGKTRRFEFNDFMRAAVEGPNAYVLTLVQFATYFEASTPTTELLAGRQEISAFKLGGTRRFRRCELDHWIAASINENETKPKGRK